MNGYQVGALAIFVLVPLALWFLSSPLPGRVGEWWTARRLGRERRGR